MPWELAALFAATLVARLAVCREQAPGFDVSGHLYFAQALRQQRCGPFGQIRMQVVGAGSFVQPFMWHWLVAHIAPEALRRHQARLNGLIDALFVPLAFWLMVEAGHGRDVALFTAAVYVLTPMWFSSIAIGPRVAGFTPRLSGEVATNLFFLLTLLDSGLWPAVTLTIATLLAMYVLSSSKFGLQAMLFLVPPISLLARDPTPALALALGLVATFLASKGRAIESIAAQLRHLAWYFRENLAGRMHISQRNSLRVLVKRDPGPLKDYLARLVQRLLSENSYTAVALKMPALALAALGCAATVGRDGLMSLGGVHAAVLAAAAVFLLVNYRPLLFLGEAERYLNHVAILVALAGVTYARQTGLEWALWALLSYGAIYLALEALLLLRMQPAQFKERLSQDERIQMDLRSRKRPHVVLCYPYHAGGGVWRVMAETQHRAVYCFGTTPEFSARFNQQYADRYPCVRLDRLQEMTDELGVDYLVLDRRELRARGLGEWKPVGRWQPLPLGGDVYAVYMLGELGRR